MAGSRAGASRKLTHDPAAIAVASRSVFAPGKLRTRKVNVRQHGLPCHIGLTLANRIPDAQVLRAQLVRHIARRVLHADQIEADVFAQHAHHAGMQIEEHAVVRGLCNGLMKIRIGLTLDFSIAALVGANQPLDTCLRQSSTRDANAKKGLKSRPFSYPIDNE